MSDTGFFVAPEKRDRAATMYRLTSRPAYGTT